MSIIVRRRRNPLSENISEGFRIEHNSPNIFPYAIDSDDWTSYANYAAFETAANTNYPVFNFTSGCSFDSVNTFNGHRTLRFQHDGSSGFDLAKEITPVQKLWMRSMFRVAPTVTAVAGGTLAMNVGNGAANSLAFNAEFATLFRATDTFQGFDKSFDEIGAGTPYTLASFQGAWRSIIGELDIVAGKARSKLYIDGVLIETLLTTTSVASWGVMNMGMIFARTGAYDPVNQYVNCGLFEYVNGDTHPAPYIMAA